MKGIYSLREEETTSSDVIVHETIGVLLIPEILNGIRPQEVTHESRSWGFSESIDLQVSFAP
jgi:hypothetical protein